MTQTLVPSADVSNAGSWTTAPLWSSIDDPNDLTPADIITKANKTTGACRVGPLVSTSGTVVDPVSSTSHILKLDGAKVGTNAVTLTVSLYQGTTLITSGLAVTLTTSYALYSYTLSAAEADAITNYADLRIDINCTAAGTSSGARVSSAWLEVPGISKITLTVANAAQAQAADNITLTAHAPSFTLVVQDAAQSQPVDNLTLTAHAPATPLTVQDAAQAQGVDNLSLTAHEPTAVLVIQDAAQLQAAENIALIQHNQIAVQDAAQLQAAQTPVLTQHQVLEVAGAAHAHSAENTDITQHHQLAVGNAGQAQSADSPTIAAHLPGGAVLEVADASQLQSAASIELVQHHILSAADAAHLQAAESLVLAAHQLLEVQDALQAQTAGSVSLIYSGPVAIQLVVQDSLQLQIAMQALLWICATGPGALPVFHPGGHEAPPANPWGDTIPAAREVITVQPRSVHSVKEDANG